MAMIIAACAEGTSSIHNIQVDRGFRDIDVRLRSIGAQIETSRNKNPIFVDMKDYHR